MPNVKLNFWTVFVLIASALIMTLGFGVYNKAITENVFAETTTLNTQTETTSSSTLSNNTLIKNENPDPVGVDIEVYLNIKCGDGGSYFKVLFVNVYGIGTELISTGDWAQSGRRIIIDSASIYLYYPTAQNGYVFDKFFVDETGNSRYVSASEGTTVSISHSANIVALFKPITYSITYDLDGGSASNPTTYNITSSFSLTAPTKTGYTFTGWTGSNGLSPQQNVSISSTTGDKNYTANWQPNTYNITFNKGSGTGGTSSSVFTYDSELPGITPPSQRGFDFKGYYTGSNGSGTCYYNEYCTSQITKFTSINVSNLYAYWVSKYYTVTLDKQGGSGGTSSVQVQNGSSMPAIIPPSWLGYTFVGYFANTNTNSTKYYNSNGTGATTWDKTDNGTINAVWTLNSCSLSVSKDSGITAFNYYAGSWSGNVESASQSNINALSILEFRVLDTQIKTGYVWNCWQISGTAGVDYDFFGGTNSTSKQMSLKIYKSITLIATTKIGVSISCVNNSTGLYTANGAGGSVKIGSGEYVPSITEGFLSGASTTLSTKGNFAYTFLGFFTAFDSNGGIGESLTYQTYNAGTENQYFSVNIANILAPQNYYAVYEIECYDLNLYAFSTHTNQYEEIPDLYGGIVKIGNQTGGAIDYGHVGYTLQININAEANDGYRFIGWYDTYEDLVADVANTQMISNNANYFFYMEDYDTDFYAKFIKTHTVTLVATTGISSVSIENKSGTTAEYYYGESIGLLSCVVDEIRYTWKNWEVTSGTEPSGTTIQLKGQEISGLVMNGYDFEFTAYTTTKKFDLNIYTIYNDSGTLVNNYTNGTNYGGLVSTTNLSNAVPYYSNIKVEYNTFDVNMTAFVNEGYTFMGWYKDVDFVSNTYSTPYLQGTTSGSAISIEPMAVEGLTYYAIFTKNYKVSIYGDSGIYSLTLTNGSQVQYDTDKYYLEAIYYYGQQIESITATIGFGFDWEEWVLGESSTLLINFNLLDRVQTTEIFMGAGDCVLTANTFADQYPLHVKAYYTDNGVYHYGNNGGSIQIASREIASEDGLDLDFQQKIAITAYPEEGYCFVGWFKTQVLTYPNENLYSGDLSTMTEPMQSNENGLTYIAVFIKTYTLTLTKWEGINSVSTTKESYYYGESVGINAIVTSGYEWDKWFLVNGLAPIDFDENLQLQTIKIQGNVVLAASTKSQKYTLDVTEMYELTNGSYTVGTTGGTVNDGEMSYLADIVSIITENEGFEFAEYFRDEALTNSYGGEVMPQNDLTLYAKFKRIEYQLTTNNIYTSALDNQTLIAGTTGGQIYSNNTIKYGCQTELTAVASDGFAFRGFYFDNLGTSVYKLAEDCNFANGNYTSSTEVMGTDGLIYYAIFERQTYTIETTGQGTTITCPSTAYFGKSISFQVEYNDAYVVSAINIYNADNIYETVNYSNNQFVMPYFDIVIETVATEKNYQITFNPNGGSFDGYTGVDVSGNIIGNTAYLTNNYLYYTNAEKTNFVSGAPLPTRNGYKLLGFNTDANALGTYYVSYNNSFSYAIWNLSEDKMLYAIWQIQSPLLNIEYVSGTQTQYNGQYQSALRVSVQNIVPNKNYIFEWFNSEGQLVSQTTTNQTSNVLSLRNVNQSSLYYCKVSIENESVFTESSSLSFSITTIDLTIDIGTQTYIGSYLYLLSNENISGLLEGHRFVSGYLSFNSGTEDIIYTNISNINHQVIIEVFDGGVWTSQQGGDLIDNYNIIFASTVTVKPITQSVKLNVGGYERTIDSNTYLDVFSENVLSNTLFDFGYEGSFGSFNTVEDNGTISNYFELDNINQTLTITFTQIPNYYKIFELYVNNVSVNYTVDLYNENIISFDLTAGMLSYNSENDFWDAVIKVYFTNVCLIEYNYNFEVLEVENGFATFDNNYQKSIIQNGQNFVAPTTPTKVGFWFDGWYFDNTTFANQVPMVWNKTGSTTIYAKWTLADLTAQNILVEVYDNNILTELFNRAYNTNSFELKFVSTNPSITYQVVWYKNQDGWKVIETSKISNIKNVLDGGEYSLSVKAIYNSQTKNLAYGVKTISINISPVELTIDFDISKIYDSTTQLGNYNIDTNINGEQFNLAGQYSSPNVNLVGGVPSQVAISNFALVSINGSLPSNYSLTNTSLFGTIIPFEYNIVKNETAVYNGASFSKTFAQNITLPKGYIQSINYTINTSSANVGIYTPNDLINNLYLDFNASATGLIADNYIITLGNASSVEITKTNLQNIYFSDQTKIYNAESQMITLKDAFGGDYSTENLPDGSIGFEFKQNENIVTGFTDFGTYLITVIIYADQNHNDWTDSASLTINKAIISIEFLFNGEALAPAYIYNSEIDMYSNLTINATNESGTNCLPNDLTKKVFQNAMEVFEVTTPNEYVIKAENYNTNYQIQGNDSQSFKIVANQYIVSEDITFENASYVFNAENQANYFVNQNLIPNLPEGIETATTIVQLFDGTNYNIVATAQNVGVYKITVGLQSQDPNIWQFDTSSITAYLTITPFNITNENTTISANKIYNGLTSLPANAKLNITSLSLQIAFGGVFASANVGTDIAINNLTISDNNFTINPSFVAKATISKANLTINLFENGISGNYIQKSYADLVQIQINKSNASKYTVGLQNNQYAVILFEAIGIGGGQYPFSDENPETNHCLINGAISIYNSSDTLIPNGIENYNLQINGGIELLMFISVPEFSNLTNLVYTGQNLPIQLVLSKYNELTEQLETLTYTYDYANEYFIDENLLIVDDLVLTILGAGSTLKNAGEYTLTLTSPYFSYLFVSEGENQYTTTVIVEKAQITFNLGDRLFVYKSVFAYSNDTAYSGVNGETFYCNFTYNGNTTTLPVGVYPLTNLTTIYEFNTSKTSTGDFTNYDITIIGNLLISARTITMTAGYDLLGLIYSAEDQISSVNAVILTFYYFDNPYAVDASDYTKKYYLGANEVSQIINAGTYTVKFTSTNYNLTGTTTFEFTISQKEITANFNINGDLVYNGAQQTPIYATFDGILGADIAQMGAKITYDGFGTTIKNAGIYSAIVSITNQNYLLTGTTVFDFNLLSYLYYVPTPSEVLFSKTFGAVDPTLETTYNVLGENVKIVFGREAGENVGKYALQNPQLSTNNSIATQSNFYIGYFEENNQGFEILAKTGVEGRLFIELLDDIEVDYNGQEYYELELQDIDPSLYQIKDYWGNILEQNDYNLVANFFFYDFVRNVGEYSIYLSDFYSTTHKDIVSLIANGKKFVINAIELTVSQTPDTTISKQYDKTSEAVLTDILFLNGVIGGDNVTLVGNYTTDGTNQVNVNENYTILLNISGTDAQNYILSYGDFFGDITQREIIVVSYDFQNENPFDKQYDKNSIVNIDQLYLDNTIYNDNVSFSGVYTTNGTDEIATVYSNCILIFTTTNPNYKIVKIDDQEYFGSITPKILTLANDSILTKQYDGTASLNTENLSLLGVVFGDNVSILSATFASEIVGTHDLDITLGGTDSENYIIETYEGTITNRIITIKYHYGDDQDYIFDFPNDEISLSYTETNTTAFYNTSLNNAQNGAKSLPSITRTGYVFAGWYTDSTTFTTQFYASTIIGNDAWSNIENLAPDYEINLFAKWIVNSYQITIELLTEEINTTNFAYSNIGGYYDIDNSNSGLIPPYFQTYYYTYYSTHTLDIIENAGFKIEEIKKNGTFVSNDLVYELTNINSSFVITIKFARELYTLALDANTTDNIISGFSGYTVSGQLATKQIKYQAQIELPILTRQGYSFLGWSLAENSEVVFSQSTTLTYQSTQATQLFAQWQTKTFNLYFDYNNGVESVGYTSLSDEKGNYIIVTYEQAIGELPILTRNGYLQDIWNLLVNSEIVETDITPSTIWLYDSANTFVLKATWLETINSIELAQRLDTSLYLAEYELFSDNPVALAYKINNGETENYSEQFEVYTNDKINITATMTHISYKFSGWYVNGVLLASGSQTIYGTTFETNGQNLKITNIMWGENCPLIEAVYVPAKVEVHLTLNNLNGSVDFAVGVFEEENKYYTFASSIIEVAYQVDSGYNVIIVVNGGNRGFSHGNLVVNQIFEDVYITFTFEICSYALTVTYSGYTEGLDSFVYNINNGTNNNYNQNINISTGDVVNFSLAIKYGYQVLANDFQIIGGGEDTLLTDLATFVQDDKNIYEKSLSQFTSSLTLNIYISKLIFNVSANVVIDQTDNYDFSSTENSVAIKNHVNTIITSIGYKEIASFVAEIQTYTTIFDLVVEKYDFLGWYSYKNLQFSLLSENLSYDKEISEDTQLFAMFKLKKFEITFALNNAEEGSLVSGYGGNPVNPQFANFGSSLTNSVVAVAKTGYSFEKWILSYDITQIESQLTSESLSSANVNNVVCNVTCTAYFVKFDINVFVNAEFDDDTEIDISKINITHNNQTSTNLNFSTQTRTNIQIFANTIQGYSFAGWLIGADSQSYIITSSTVSVDNLSAELNIQFVEGEATYTITAIFERTLNEITVQLVLDNGAKLGGGVVTTEQNYFTGATLITYAKTFDTLKVFVYVHYGYFIDLNRANLVLFEVGNGEYVFESAELIADASAVYSAKYLLTISSFDENLVIKVFAERNTTTLHFYEQNFQAINQNEKYNLSETTATIKYGTTQINIENSLFLTPNNSGYTFQGWSISKYISGLIINKYGNINSETWQINAEDIYLYPIWEQKKVKIDIKLNPENAKIDSSYYEELFNNLTLNKPIKVGLSYYFFVGATFGISFPEVHSGYIFVGYKLLTYNQDNTFSWISVSLNSSDFLRTQFSIEDYDHYEYSSATNFAQLGDVIDGTMYIELVYNIEVFASSANYYTDNRISTIGGTATIQNIGESGNISSGQEITVIATPQTGYTLKYLIINGNILETQTLYNTFSIYEPTSIVAVFVGDKVIVNLGLSLNGTAKAITGGNLETINLTKYYHIGDIIILDAESNIGYNFENNWNHSKTGDFVGSSYTIVLGDIDPNGITLTPIFTERDLLVEFVMINKFGTISKEGVRFDIVDEGNNQIYKFYSKYFDDINVQISPKPRHVFEKVLLKIGTTTTNVTSFTSGTNLIITSNYFANANKIVFEISFTNLYWYNIMTEKNYVTETQNGYVLNRDLFGSGKEDDPYRIESIDDFTIWAFIINHNILQTNIQKFAYNSSNTHYEVSTEISFLARYWTPIGTSVNPFNAIVYLYEPRKDILVDRTDTNYPYYTLFNNEVVTLWNGLFGYLSDTAQIFEVVKNYDFVYFVIGGIAGIVVIAVLIIVFVNKKHKYQIETYDKNKNPFV